VVSIALNQNQRDVVKIHSKQKNLKDTFHSSSSPTILLLFAYSAHCFAGNVRHLHIILHAHSHTDAYTTKEGNSHSFKQQHQFQLEVPRLPSNYRILTRSFQTTLLSQNHALQSQQQWQSCTRTTPTRTNPFERSFIDLHHQHLQCGRVDK
jgi:hypothetical protein